jgi:hypothetical protein
MVWTEAATTADHCCMLLIFTSDGLLEDTPCGGGDRVVSFMDNTAWRQGMG